MALQTAPVKKESKKRKKGLDLDWLDGFFNVKPEDYESAWKSLRDRFMELKNAASIPTVSLYQLLCSKLDCGLTLLACAKHSCFRRSIETLRSAS
jgi:hypothetical protein